MANDFTPDWLVRAEVQGEHLSRSRCGYNPGDYDAQPDPEQTFEPLEYAPAGHCVTGAQPAYMHWHIGREFVDAVGELDAPAYIPSGGVMNDGGLAVTTVERDQ